MAGQDSLYASACIDTKTNELIIKIVNTIGKAQSVAFDVEELKKTDAIASVTVLQRDDMNAVNSFELPMNISPVEGKLVLKGKRLQMDLVGNSLSVIRVPLD